MWLGLRRRIWWSRHRRDERSHPMCGFEGHVDTLHNWHMALAGQPMTCPVCRMTVPNWGPPWEGYRQRLAAAQQRYANRVIGPDPQETDSGSIRRER